MTKEEILKQSKEMVKLVMNKGVPDPAYVELLQKETSLLNSCDMLWLDDEYGKWFKKEVLPKINKYYSKGK